MDLVSCFLLFLPVTHVWNPTPVAMGREECFHVTIFASMHPDKPTSWSSVLSSFFFGGNGEWPTPEGLCPQQEGTTGHVVLTRGTSQSDPAHRLCAVHTGGAQSVPVCPLQPRWPGHHSTCP
jgi:hypothetical protein